MGEIINENKKATAAQDGDGEGKKGFCVFFPLFFRSFQGSLTFVPPMSQLSDAAVPGRVEPSNYEYYYII